MKNILVATDFSHDAYCAIFYAAKLLSSKHCRFYILNVYDKNTPLRGKRTKLFGSKKRLDELRVESEERLTETLHKIVMDDENDLHQFEAISKEGILTRVIADIVDELKIDLVVMGNKGHTGAAEIFFGGNTVRVMNAISECALLAVPKQMDFKEPREIAFVTDYKKGCIKEVLDSLLFVVSLFGASVRVVHINEGKVLTTEQESHRKLLQLCLKDVEHSFHTRYEYTEKAMAIDSYLEKSGIDMFCMVNHKRGFFEKLFREPVIKDISIYSEVPLLIIPHQD